MEKTIVRKFTLSSYDKGQHTVDGKTPKYASFVESLGPLHRMIEEFSEYPTGTKIKVTFEVVKQ